MSAKDDLTRAMMNEIESRRTCMFLAYLDDSGTADKGKPFQVMTAVVVPDSFFASAEILATGSLAVHIPHDKSEQFWQNFQEFKAWELFGGYGPFEGMDRSVRSSITEALLTIVGGSRLSIVYGAVEKAKLRQQVYGSANPTVSHP